ncbi:sel1 repeat family protein (plasmid) [Streptomyces canus]|uniref:sel1 repeat family protein n=1 Tax=Streptomyces canus TaxID=58343 RepID=UPI002E28FC0B|nr:sel1 repeat family protein [Streptomyces canus]
MSRTPEIFEDLRRVGALKRDRLGGRPSDNTLSKSPSPTVSRDTVGVWLRGGRLPQQVEPLLAVMREIRAEAARQGCLEDSADRGSGESVADLLAEGRWKESWKAEQRRRGQAARQGVERHQAHKALEDGERRARQAALRDRPRPVRSWSLQRLGVHEAIPGRRADPDSTGFIVPTYVPRPHDDRLRARLAGAVGEEAASLLVVVRGESCTGKTRTAAEALKAAVPDDFKLLLPAGADDLLAALAADALGPRSVLWLNEAQDYLDGPAGEAVAAALLRRLDADGPFVVIATLWPDHDDTFTATPVSSADDPHRQARVLLAQAHYAHVPDSFAGALNAARRAADHDASLAAALEAGGAHLTQTLAAGPDLVTHYEHPAGTHGIYGKALLSAAMDAHRVGVTQPLPLDFLCDAAPGYLTDGERAAADPDTWFTGALAHAQTLIKQITRPLLNVSRSSGMGALPGVVRLADYLQQHGRRTRWHLCPPASFWDAAAEHITAPEDLTRLANDAKIRLRYRHAAQLYCAVADRGHPFALVPLARMREAAGDREAAERLFRAAADRGDTTALVILARMREHSGDRTEAEQLAQAAADRGHPSALGYLARMREHAGDKAEAERLAHAAADRGHPSALLYSALMREAVGDHEGAEQMYRAAADRGYPFALVPLALMRDLAGDQEEVERLAHAVTESGDPSALLSLARMREHAGDKAEAERLAHAAAEGGDTSALLSLVQIREEARDKAEAERLAHAAAERGDTSALVFLAGTREAAEGRKEAERMYRAAADGGDASALLSLALRREAAGDQREAERLAQAAADRGHPSALVHLALMREKAGDRAEAERLAHAAADRGHPSALVHLALMREKAGARAEAERLAHAAADRGHPSALVDLAVVWEKAGVRAEAERMYRAAADRGDNSALLSLARRREKAGDRAEAERLAHAAADRGHSPALGYLAELRHGVVEDYQRYGLEADGTLAASWAWPEPRCIASDAP